MALVEAVGVRLLCERIMIRLRKLHAALVAALLVSAAAASAEIVTSAVRLGNFTFSDAQVSLPLTPGQLDTILFQAPPDWYVLTFSAECAVVGTAPSPYLDIDVFVDEEVVPITKGDTDAFCSAVGPTNTFRWTRASITVPVNLKPIGPDGYRRITVKARLNGATAGWVGDSALLLTK